MCSIGDEGFTKFAQIFYSGLNLTYLMACLNLIPKLHLYGENLEMMIFPIIHAIEPLYTSNAVVAGWLQSTRAYNTDTVPVLCNKGDHYL